MGDHDDSCFINVNGAYQLKITWYAIQNHNPVRSMIAVLLSGHLNPHLKCTNHSKVFRYAHIWGECKVACSTLTLLGKLLGEH